MVRQHMTRMQLFWHLRVQSTMLRQEACTIVPFFFPAKESFYSSNDVFRELLLRLRNGETTREDWNLRTPTNAVNKTIFSKATHLYYDKMSVTSFNIDKLKSIGKPIARVNALHSHQAAAIATPEDAG